MNTIVEDLIRTGGRHLVGWLFDRLTSPRRRSDRVEAILHQLVESQRTPAESPKQVMESVFAGTSQVSAAGRACIPCGDSHFSTVSGALAEAMRFARDGGIEHPEVLTRIAHAEDELNVFEREDGTPEKIVALPPEEKALMDEMLVASRQLRHRLSGVTDIQSLEKAAAEAQERRRHFRAKVFRLQLGKLTAEEKEKVKHRAEQLVAKELEGVHGADE